MSVFKKISNKFSNTEFSKRLVFIVTSIWILSTIVNYLFQYFGITVIDMTSTYSEISDVFKITAIGYLSKSGVENINKIKSTIDRVVEDVAADMNKKGE